MKRYVILVLVLLGLIKVLSTKVVEIRVKRVCPLVPTAETLTSHEADTFLRQWTEYVNRGYRNKVPEDFSSDEVNISDRLPWIVRFWMAKNCIDPKRFYYTEQRFRSILKTHELKKHADAVISILSAQMAEGVDADKKAWYEDLIEKQKKLPKIEGVTDDELNMIKGREQEIEKLLK